VATAVEPEGIDREIGQLKSEIGKMLAGISDRLATESSKFRSLQKATESKERELKELYGQSKKAAVSLGCSHRGSEPKRDDFETDMARKREELQTEIELPSHGMGEGEEGTRIRAQGT